MQVRDGSIELRPLNIRSHLKILILRWLLEKPTTLFNTVSAKKCRRESQ